MLNKTILTCISIVLAVSLGQLSGAETSIKPAGMNYKLEKKIFTKTTQLLQDKNLTPQQVKKIQTLQTDTQKYLTNQKGEVEALKAKINLMVFEDPGALGVMNELAAKMHDLSEQKTKYLTNALAELEKI